MKPSINSELDINDLKSINRNMKNSVVTFMYIVVIGVSKLSNLIRDLNNMVFK